MVLLLLLEFRGFFLISEGHIERGLLSDFYDFFYSSQLESKVKFILRVICHSVAEVRLRNLNPPTFCLVCSIITRLWIHEMPTCGACYVCNAIRASYSEATKKRDTYFLLQPEGVLLVK